jgi:hypothetical protein
VEASTTPAEAVTPAAEDGDDRPEGSLAYKPVRRVQLAEEVPGAELDESPADAAAMPPGEASVPADDAPVPTYDDSVPTEDGKVEEPAGPARRSPSAKKSARPASGRSPRGR